MRVNEQRRARSLLSKFDAKDSRLLKFGDSFLIPHLVTRIFFICISRSSILE
ncbi:hypothetical protein VCHA53O466_160035 [Vibrio chagasii]|nr:hypothetical protein VCHA53O466_160035 [Vibrio chagasii]